MKCRVQIDGHHDFDNAEDVSIVEAIDEETAGSIAAEKSESDSANYLREDGTIDMRINGKPYRATKHVSTYFSCREIAAREEAGNG